MVTVSWVATASSNTVESNTRLHRPDNTPVSATTARTASNTRSGAELFRSLALHKVNTVGWNPSSVNDKPAAAFQRISQRNRPIASRSDSPSNACNTNTVATTKSRYRRTTPTTAQIPEQLIREHPQPVLSQKRVNRPLWNQATTHQQRIQQPTIKTFSTQHPPIIPKTNPQPPHFPNPQHPSKSAGS